MAEAILRVVYAFASAFALILTAYGVIEELIRQWCGSRRSRK